ncbi:glycosyltransferase family A protein [Caulobacter sp. UNC279MFTsu5.1]|uniref:polysaccharide biosynthesis protein HfsG n=1 Tax=Caulobacter sp. UNC279MFTsu5.1 TaxID=1502775 RepID=UPI0003740ED5|nr:glycosyltransferase family A protein [Caulobacter sp. UNC279MFTsu5.1]SFK36699.1 Glycosyl transferase family 2 [Caulobacter sp. UNC279MFTsu5.1]
MTAATETLTDNAAWADATPRLSVLIPTYRDDPSALLKALDERGADAEIVLLDDGGGDAALTRRMAARIEKLKLPARLVVLSPNEGRAKGRNRLARHARGRHLLFLDSDMLPDPIGFLTRWSAVAADDVPVAFGGFTLDQTPRRPEHELHRAMALKSDCTPAPERAKEPEKHVFTSNLLVRRDVFDTIGFDEGFAGWGWEDVEWAMRVARQYPILHIDNSATHLGLDTAAVLAAKYEQSAANFARVVASHHEVVSAYPSYKVAKSLKSVPLRGTWRPMLKAFALNEAAPTPLRALALRLYRAALYSDAV